MATVSLSFLFTSAGRCAQTVPPFRLTAFRQARCGAGLAVRGSMCSFIGRFLPATHLCLPTGRESPRSLPDLPVSFRETSLSLFPRRRTLASCARSPLGCAPHGIPSRQEPPLQALGGSGRAAKSEENAEMERGPLVGFLGLGNMGLPMATLLARRGVRLCVYDPLKPRAVQYVTQFGAVPACSVEDLGCKLRESIFSSNPELRARGTEARRQQDDAKTRMQASDPLRERRHPFLAMSSEFPHPVALQNEAHPGETNEGATPTLARQSGGERSPFGLVVCMLPTGRHVGEVLFSKHGLLDALDGHACAKNVEAPGTCRALVIDCSTIGPLQAAEVAAGAERRGHHFVDAPVSGGVPAATAGTLTFMVGGSRNDVAIASPLLRLMGSRVVHCGEAVGTGQAFKVCNNLILAASMLGVAEAFRLGEALGVDLKLLNDVVNASSGRCWSAEQYNPAPGIVDGAPASRAYAGGFSVDLIVKDLVLCRDAFEAHPLTCPVTDAALTMFRSMSDKGHGHLDIGCAFRHNT